MATSNTIPVVIPQPIAAQATSENINVIPNGATGTNLASFQEGFPAITRMPVIENPLPTQVSGLPPKQQDFNGLFNVVSQHNFFAQNGGTYSFNQAVSDAIGGYPKNAVLWYFPENGTPCLVRSLINDNTNNFVNDPTLIDGIHWEMLVNPSSYANLALTNSPYTTNRILEIPQDIKLELNNGTLTLKAGSKVYVPNGFEADGTTQKFDVKIIGQDLTITFDNTIQKGVIISPNNTMVHGLLAEHFISSSTAPSISWGYWYDLTNNQIKWTNDGSTWISGYSLLICIATGTNGSVTSIDQVFNGFGYIGSTVFVLPGVKVQAPNGKNADGTCRSIIATVDSVKTTTITGSPTANMKFYLSSNLSLFLSDRWSFDADKNMYVSSLGVVSAVEIAYGYLTSGKITSFEPFTVDSVANSNASNFSQAGRSYLSGLGMPSGRYIDLTLGAKRSTYTAPANGWFYFIGKWTNADSYFQMRNTTISPLKPRIQTMSVTASGYLGLYMPVRAGDNILIDYHIAPTEVNFAFIYAQGEQ